MSERKIEARESARTRLSKEHVTADRRGSGLLNLATGAIVADADY